jgi:hypothetical protein
MHQTPGADVFFSQWLLDRDALVDLTQGWNRFLDFFVEATLALQAMVERVSL